MIPCAQCGYENDATRVFCHNCGNRLEQTGAQTSIAPAGLASDTRQAPPPPARQTSQTAKRRDGDSPGLLSSFLRLVISTAILAAILACIVQMLRPPLNIPRPLKPSDMAAQELFTSLKGSSGNPALPIWVTNAVAINNYLMSTLHPVSSPGLVQFQEAFVVFGQGTFRLWLVQSYGGYPVYYAIDIRPVSQNGGTGAEVVGSEIGHLPLHPLIAPFVAKMFAPMITSLDEPLQIIRNARAVDINPNNVKITWPTAGAPAPK